MRFIFLISFIIFFTYAKAQIFYAEPFSTIPDGDGWQNFNLDVSGVGIIDCNFKLCININNSYYDGFFGTTVYELEDIDIRLISPFDESNGIRVSTNNGSWGDDYNNTCFTMDASISINDGSDPYCGDYIPEGNNNGDNFNSYLNSLADGTWTLRVRDQGNNQSTCELNWWSLDFSCEETTNICSNANLTFTTDDYAEEFLWQIVNNDNQILYHDNYCIDDDDESTFNYQFCLENGCYDFIVYDSYGDGFFTDNNTFEISDDS